MSPQSFLLLFPFDDVKGKGYSALYEMIPFYCILTTVLCGGIFSLLTVGLKVVPGSMGSSTPRTTGALTNGGISPKVVGGINPSTGDKKKSKKSKKNIFPTEVAAADAKPPLASAFIGASLPCESSDNDEDFPEGYSDADETHPPTKFTHDPLQPCSVPSPPPGCTCNGRINSTSKKNQNEEERAHRDLQQMLLRNNPFTLTATKLYVAGAVLVMLMGILLCSESVVFMSSGEGWIASATKAWAGVVGAADQMPWGKTGVLGETAVESALGHI